MKFGLWTEQLWFDLTYWTPTTGHLTKFDIYPIKFHGASVIVIGLRTLSKKMCSTMPITTPVKKNKIIFFVRLCLNVLLEVLFFSNRRRLGKLECVSSRFHWLVEHFINKKPFLRLDLQLNSWLVFLAKLVVYHKNWR